MQLYEKCDTLIPGVPLITRQPVETSGCHHIPFIEIHNLIKNRTKSSLYGKLYPKYNLYNNISHDPSGLNMPHRVIHES